MTCVLAVVGVVGSSAVVGVVMGRMVAVFGVVGVVVGVSLCVVSWVVLWGHWRAREGHSSMRVRVVRGGPFAVWVVPLPWTSVVSAPLTHVVVRLVLLVFGALALPGLIGGGGSLVATPADAVGGLSTQRIELPVILPAVLAAVRSSDGAEGDLLSATAAVSTASTPRDFGNLKD